MLNILIIIAIISNAIMFSCLVYFAHGLRWSVKEDRSAIIGFGWMMVTVVLSTSILASGYFS